VVIRRTGNFGGKQNAKQKLSSRDTHFDPKKGLSREKLQIVASFYGWFLLL